jgi:hypothetical protein
MRASDLHKHEREHVQISAGPLEREASKLGVYRHARTTRPRNTTPARSFLHTCSTAPPLHHSRPIESDDAWRPAGHPWIHLRVLCCPGRGGHFEPENRTEPNPNNLNCRSIRVWRFKFGPDKFIILSSVLVLVVYNLKFNIVVYFDSNYDVTTLCFKLLFKFFSRTC